MTVHVSEHPAGSLLVIEHDGACLMLDRAQVLLLLELLETNLGAMPVKI